MTAEPMSPTQGQVYVWDRFVRAFHWSLVVLVTISFLTEDEVVFLHVWAGYSVGVLLMARIVWGIVGTRYARFTDFVYRPRKVKEYLLAMLSFRAPRFLGHSPAGGAMAVALILSLGATVAAGIAADNRVAASGHGGFIGGVHEALANLTMILIFVHVAGVVVSSFSHRENLVRAMITGWKRR